MATAIAVAFIAFLLVFTHDREFLFMRNLSSIARHSESPTGPRCINIIIGILAVLGSSGLSIAMPASVRSETLPFIGTQAQAQRATANSDRKFDCILLQGAISDEIYPRLERRANELVDIALQRQTDADVLNKKGKHFNGTVSLAWAGARDILELLTEYKGFEQSSEAGDIILGEKLKIKSKGSADYAKQLRRDQIERDVFAAIMEMAEGLGCADSGQSKSEKVVNFSLSVTGYSPTVISPVSQIAWAMYIATQGGPEEAKLLQEIYLGKRFESRYKTLDACADLAVNGHNNAVITKNPALLAVSEWMIDRASEVHKMPIAAKPIIQSTNLSPPCGLLLGGHSSILPELSQTLK
jgi:hypothetical protein